MKNRIISKQNKKFYKKNILDPIKNAGLKLKSIKWVDGYYLFYTGKSSVLHFIFEDMPYVKFGVWRNYDGEPYVIFGEDMCHIDKFKPTQTTNFTLVELINLIKDYKAGKLSYRYIIENIFNHYYDDITDSLTDDEWMQMYINEMNDIHFSRNNNYLSRDEYKLMNAHKEKCIKELCASPYINRVFFRRTPDFAFDYGSIEVCYSSKCDEFTQEEFDKFDEDISKFVMYINPKGDKMERTFLCYNEWRALAKVHSDKDLHKIIYTGKKKKMIKNLTQYK